MTSPEIHALARDVAEKRLAYDTAYAKLAGLTMTAETVTTEAQRIDREIREAKAEASVAQLFSAFDEARQALRKAVAGS